MFIELAEFLRCPACGDEVAPLVVAPDAMEGRSVRAGQVGCPACRREFDVLDGVVRFGDPAEPDERHALPSDASAEGIRALLGLSGPGGYVLLVGEAARLASAMTEQMPGVHWIVVNPPRDAMGSSAASTVQSGEGIPLRTGVVRGAVVGPDYARPEWLAEAARAVLRGLRMVVFGEPAVVDGVLLMASSAGVWVGERS